MTAFDQLRDEIKGFQSSRSELFKWKFLLVGTTMAAGLGFSEHAPIGSAWLLLLAPGLAIYCDLLILDYDIRIAVIATFLRSVIDASVHGAYEQYVAQKELAAAWVLGRLALWGSTAAVCVSVTSYGVYLRTLPKGDAVPAALETVVGHWWVLVVGGLSWSFAVAIIGTVWASQCERVRKTAPNEKVFEHLRRGYGEQT